MAIDSLIKDGFGTGKTAHVHAFAGKRNKKHHGLLVQQEPFLQLNPEFHPFIHSTFGTAMNQNISIGGGSTELIHNGTDAVGWTGTAVSGTWDFSDTTNPSAGSNCVSLTSGNNADEAVFSDVTETNMTAATTITGQIRLETYNNVNNSILLQFENNNVDIGNSVNLNDYINTGTLGSYQSFVIPKANMGITTQTVDEIDIVVTRTGGSKPTFRFDEFQIETGGGASATPAIFKTTTPIGTRYHINQLRLILVDAFTGIITASTTTYPTMPGLAYNQLLGVSALSNGVIFQRVQDGKVNLSITLRQLSDFFDIGLDIINLVSDGTNTMLTLGILLPDAIILEGPLEDNFLSLTINDDLSGLLLFTAATRGALEV